VSRLGKKSPLGRSGFKSGNYIIRIEELDRTGTTRSI
jgi:hypothetical protein